MSNPIDRQVAIDAVLGIGYTAKLNDGDEVVRMSAVNYVLRNLPSAEPEPSEITDEQAILHLQSTGWMQNHDREMYESGLREQLADDSGSYDSLIPCEDTISRQDAMDALEKIEGCFPYRVLGERNTYSQYNEGWSDAICTAQSWIKNMLPSAEPEPLSDAYMKAVWTWLLDYQIKAAELEGRYTPYEVLSWVANDWRKEHEGFLR